MRPHDVSRQVTKFSQSGLAERVVCQIASASNLIASPACGERRYQTSLFDGEPSSRRMDLNVLHSFRSVEQVACTETLIPAAVTSDSLLQADRTV